MANHAFWLNRRLLDPVVRDEIERIRVVDTHEHLEEEGKRLATTSRLSRFLVYYGSDDPRSAGAFRGSGPGLFDEKLDSREQWKLLRDVWPLVRHTGYSTAIRLSIRELYGIKDLDDSTIEPLMRAVGARNRPGVLEWILRDKCRIECCLVDSQEVDPGDVLRDTTHPDLFLFDMGVARFLENKMDIAPYEKMTGISCGSLADWKRILDWYFEHRGKRAVAIKNQCSYWRTLRFEDVPEAEAEAPFEKWLLRKGEVTEAERRKVQDFTFHHLIRRAIDFNLPVKIHTGYHAGTGYMDLANTRPSDLNNIIRQYPKARFDLFHMGYPYQGEVLAMAKHFPNVMADMCWAWIMDPAASLEFARGALVALPTNKMFGFGGDYGYADNVYGHLRIARDGIALVLTEAIKDGRLTRADAKAVARRWLRDNAMEFFRIGEKRESQAGPRGR
jgi:hypothetical protein